MDAIKKLGLQPPAPPSPMHRQVEFPEDLSNTPIKDLGTQLSVWVNLLNYASYQRQLFESDCEHYEYQRQVALEDHYHQNTHKDRPVAAIKAEAARASRSIGEKERENKLIRDQLQTFCEMFERNYAAVSREISRRQSQAIEEGTGRTL
jgi:hypothetical protein